MRMGIKTIVSVCEAECGVDPPNENILSDYNSATKRKANRIVYYEQSKFTTKIYQKASYRFCRILFDTLGARMWPRCAFTF